MHIAVIMDGNRRYTKHLMKTVNFGHESGLKKARQMLEWVNKINLHRQNKINEVTAYCLSFENFNSRPKTELDFILSQLDKECDEIKRNPSHPVNKYFYKVSFIGKIDLLPEQLQEKMSEVQEKTKQNSLRLNLAVAYGGQQEIVYTLKKIAEKVKDGLIDVDDIDLDLIKETLYTDYSSFPDLIVRTGGEKRLSNFLCFQSAYSELIFTEKKWPELEENDFIEFLKEFDSRKRRYGK